MNEWTSLELGGICSVSVPPTCTTASAGKNLNSVAPPALSLPAWMVFCRPLGPFARLTTCSYVFASSFFAAFLSFFLDGIGRLGLTTLTLAFMPGWTVQTYVYVPVFGNFSV